MFGHGCPHVVLRTLRRASVCVTVFVSVLVGEDLNAAGPAVLAPQQQGAATDTAIENTATEIRQSHDVATRPLVFRSANPDWPLSPSGDDRILTVATRSFAEHADEELLLSYELVRIQDGTVVGREQTAVRLDVRGDCEPVPIASSAPKRPGVYEIRCTLSRKPDKIWSRITGDKGDLVDVRTPWLVYAPSNDAAGTGEGNVPIPIANSAGSIAPPHWEAVRNVTAIDPANWEPASWIPESANTLVPNVKRVTGSISLTPWRQHSDDGESRLTQGQSFVGVLDDLTPRGPYQITVRLTPKCQPGEAIPVRLEFAATPGFEKIDQAMSRMVSVPLDLSGDQSDTEVVYRVVHYPETDREFLRLVNESTKDVVQVGSVTLSRLDTGTPLVPEPTYRSVSLVVDSPNWVGQFVPDHRDLQSQHRTARSTAALFRLWTGLERLQFYARWHQFDSIRVPTASIDDGTRREGKESTEGKPEPDPLWLTHLHRRALVRWTVGSRCDVAIQPQTGAATDSPGETLATAESQRIPVVDLTSLDDNHVHLASALIDALIRRDAKRVSIRCGEFPLVLSAHDALVLKQFVWTPTGGKHVPPAHGNGNGVAGGGATPGHSPAGNVNAHPDNPSAGILVLHTQNHCTIVNPAPWSSTVRLDVMPRQVVQCRLAKPTQSRATIDQPGVGQPTVIAVPPQSIINLDLDAGIEQAFVRRWDAAVDGGVVTLESLKSRIAGIVGKIGRLAMPEDYLRLRNGGFETQGKVGIVGWMHTQFPSTAVTLDDKEAIEGTYSVRMETDETSAGRTWLVSEPIAVPPTGRLAISMSTRAGTRPLPQPLPQVGRPFPAKDEGESDPKHHVRVSLEGIRNGTPVRFAADFHVPCDGKWQPRRLLLECSGIRPHEIDSLRLTIDSLSPGTLWIDDVHLHDRYATLNERNELQGQAFLAIKGLQQRDLKPVAELLNNRWALHLASQTEFQDWNRGRFGSSFQEDGAATQSGAEGSDADADANDGKNPQQVESVAERIRSWLPRPLRF